MHVSAFTQGAVFTLGYLFVWILFDLNVNVSLGANPALLMCVWPAPSDSCISLVCCISPQPV